SGPGEHRSPSGAHAATAKPIHISQSSSPSRGCPGTAYSRIRRTDAGFLAYQTRFAKFFLSMLYLNAVYQRMAEEGPALLDEGHGLRADRVAELVRNSTGLDTAENVQRLEVLDRSYRKLGGRYAAFAETLAPRRARLLDEARQDMADFARLIESWEPLMRASDSVGVPAPRR
ncbi:DUF6271 family protein, partial [Streptomyces boncukensis]|uniref:DUF6271 family protein n=1 Tax=Streptomyces boncukensis TaxID=2711219 RepID=UPI001F497E8C